MRLKLLHCYYFLVEFSSGLKICTVALYLAINRYLSQVAVQCTRSERRLLFQVCTWPTICFHPYIRQLSSLQPSSQTMSDECVIVDVLCLPVLYLLCDFATELRVACCSWNPLSSFAEQWNQNLFQRIFIGSLYLLHSPLMYKFDEYNLWHVLLKSFLPVFPIQFLFLLCQIHSEVGLRKNSSLCSL